MGVVRSEPLDAPGECQLQAFETIVNQQPQILKPPFGVHQALVQKKEALPLIINPVNDSLEHLIMVLCQLPLEALEPGDHPLGCRRWRRRPQIGDQIGNGKINLVPYSRNNGNP